jgi:hypothetical protein
MPRKRVAALHDAAVTLGHKAVKLAGYMGIIEEKAGSRRAMYPHEKAAKRRSEGRAARSVKKSQIRRFA